MQQQRYAEHMIHQKHIIPLDNQGSFLLAIYFNEHKVGGECTWFSDQVYFGCGNITDCQSLTDVTELCTMPRSANKKAAHRLQQMADAQRELGGDPERAWMYAQQAEKARQPAQFVPRSCLASRNGIVVLGFDCEDDQSRRDYVRKVVDVNNQSVIKETSYSGYVHCKMILHPAALSSDGKSFVYCDTSRPTDIKYVADQVLKQRSLFKKSRKQPLVGVKPEASVVSNEHGRVAVDEKQVHVYGHDPVVPERTWPAPKGVFNWTLKASFGSSLIAFSGDKGVIKLLDTNTGQCRVFYPHKGCKRDDMAVVTLSDDGRWMASKVCSKKQLMVTDLDSGQSWQVANLEEQLVIEDSQETYQIRSLIPPAFAFIGHQLLISEGRSVSSIDYDASELKDSSFVAEQGQSGAQKPLNINRQSSLETIIKKAGLDSAAQQLNRFHSPALKINSKASKKAGWHQPGKPGAPALGSSRLGGWPDLPVGHKWPQWHDRPMSFLAQINLSEVHAVNPAVRLPATGLLLFFMGCDVETCEDDTFGFETYIVDLQLGSELSDREGWQVIYVADGEGLQRMVFEGTIKPQLFQPCQVKFQVVSKSLPDEQTVVYDHLKLSDNQRDHYNEVLDLVAVDNWDNQLMGYPELIQSTPPELYCAGVLSGRQAFAFPDPDSEECQLLEEQAGDWTLLLQLSSDDNPDFLWGDGGHLYFYGQRDQMAIGEFNETWLYFEN
jgi:uncharacterized protein YwqG